MQWAKSVGLTAPTAAELRAVPVEKTLGRSFPFVDGQVVRHSPGVPFHAHTEARIPFIIGSNSDESSLLGGSSAIARLALGGAYDATLADYRRRPGAPAEAAERDLNEDVGSVQQSLFLADMHATTGAPTYAFYFDQVPPADRAKRVGAEHGGEIEYLFGNKPAEHDWDAADRRVSQLMGDYWVRFAKTGDPNGAGAPRWPQVKGHPTVQMVFGAETRAAPSTELEERVRATTLAAVIKLWGSEAASQPVVHPAGR